MTFKIEPSHNQQWYFRIVATNGRTLAHSETYHHKSDCRSAAQSIINEAGSGCIVE